MPTAPSRRATSASDLITLALEHCIMAERSACPERQRELYRVAEIYTALATMDLAGPTSVAVECPEEADSHQFTDAIE